MEQEVPVSSQNTRNSVVAFETELNSIVQEYLDFCSYKRTSQAFEDECIFLGKHLQRLAERRESQRTMAIQNEMLEHLRKGNRKLFFESWERNIPRELRNSDAVAKKLEFYLHMYFAVHPLKYGPLYQMHAEESMAAFRKYLETRGSVLSRTNEFLPFYALPFVDNPKTHPTYRDLFSDLWMQEIQIRLEKFLTLTLDSVQQPRLFELYKTAHCQGGHQEYISKINILEQKLYESEKKGAQYSRRHVKVQRDYHNLIGITAELVDALESTLQGKKIAPDFLQEILARLFSRRSRGQPADWDLNRPGSAAEAVRQTARSQKKARTEIIEAEPVAEIDLDAYPPNLDFSKVKIDLIKADSRRKALLLQALRWRLSKSPPGDHRAVILRAMIEDDALGCTQDGAYRQEVMGLLRTSDELLQPSMAKLLNSFASFYEGRKYLTRNPELINTIIEVLRSGDKTDPNFISTAENLLATLQKLSLRRAVQTQVIEAGLVEWLIEQLDKPFVLGDYSLEYSIALMMNLCLRSSGKRASAGMAEKAITALCALLAHNNQDILPYVNGTLYSILSVASVREEAKRLNLEETLRSLMQGGNADNNRQLEYIIKQLNTTENKDIVDSDDENEEEFDDAEQDGIEPEVDLGDRLQAEENEKNGERLLITEYYTRPSASARKSLLSRPATGQANGAASASGAGPAAASDNTAASLELAPLIQANSTNSHLNPNANNSPLRSSTTVAATARAANQPEAATERGKQASADKLESRRQDDSNEKAPATPPKTPKVRSPKQRSDADEVARSNANLRKSVANGETNQNPNPNPNQTSRALSPPPTDKRTRRNSNANAVEAVGKETQRAASPRQQTKSVKTAEKNGKDTRRGSSPPR